MIRIGGKEMAVVILELPYIFGRMPEECLFGKSILRQVEKYQQSSPKGWYNHDSRYRYCRSRCCSYF